tara:strand:- start:158 stop:613 length:456 start_codon:yes stop_codon:yes gene_type:complete
MALRSAQLCNPNKVAFSTTTGWDMNPAASPVGPAVWTSIDLGESGAYDAHDVTGTADVAESYIPGGVKKAQTITLEGFVTPGLPESPVLTEQTATFTFPASPGFSSGGSRVYTVFAPKGIVRMATEVNGVQKCRLELQVASGTVTVTNSAA